MNVIIVNKYKDALSNLNIDIIKKMEGEFTAETIISTFSNFYYNRMIIDITALKDHFEISTIQKLCSGLDASKIIFFLDDNPKIDNNFLSKIISLGIYNFTRELSGVTYLMENPNSYRDVAQYHDLAFGSSNSNSKSSKSSSSNNYSYNSYSQSNQTFPTYNTNQMYGLYSDNSLNNTIMPNYGAETPIPAYPQTNNINTNNNFNNNQNFNGGNSFNNNQNINTFVTEPSISPNQFVDSNVLYTTLSDFGMNNPLQSNYVKGKEYIIGFKDVTPDAGATTLIYMLKKQFAKVKKVLAVEINNNDFSFFKDKDLISTNSNQFASLRGTFFGYDVILIDLNNAGLDIESVCDDVIYLLEPSTIKINSLIRSDRQALLKIKNKKIVLNKSLLDVNDVKQFEYESNVKLFYNIPPLDERKDSQMVLESFIEKLGVIPSNSNKDGKLFSSIFKH